MERLTDEQRERVAELAWIGRMYAARFVRKHGLRGAACDSVESAAGWAVMLVVRRYRPAHHGDSIRDYAVRTVPSAIIESLRLENGRPGERRRELADRTCPLTIDFGREWPPFEAVDAADELRALPVPPKALAMSLRYIGEDRPAPEVARMFGMSESGVKMAWAGLRRRVREGQLNRYGATCG